ncbi:hypothetical protein EPUL_004700, partial [Erysiphe pulchra]
MRAGLIEKSSPSQQIMTYKSFRFNAKVETAIAGTKKIVALDINSTHVDQGADLNLISDYLVKILRFQTIKLPKPILFGTAEGRLTNATNFTKIRIGVSGVWRCAEALVLPPGSGNPCSIILGLPWLFDVCGNLDIPTFTLKIGDITEGEKRVELQTTRFKLGQNSRLRLMLADQRTIELAKAQIVARDLQSKRSEKHVQFISESESDSDDDESLIESDGSSEDSASSEKDCVSGSLVMLYDHARAKLKLHASYRGPFVVAGFAGEHKRSYLLRQVDGQKEDFYHGDQLGPFRLREAYLITGNEKRIPAYQNLRSGKASYEVSKPTKYFEGSWTRKN